MISKNTKIDDIFRQFLYHDKLKFNEIEKKTSIRSNELAYLLKRMISDGVLTKQDERYLLTPEYEKKIPYFSDSSETSPLPVVLIACVREDNSFLMIKRKKRPYKDYWSLVGGRIRTSETIRNAALRILKEKTFVDGKFISVNAVVNEKYGTKGKIKNSFILFFTKVKALSAIKEKENLQWFNMAAIKKLMIVPSDLWLLENDINSKIEVKEEILEDEDEGMSIKFIK